MKDVVALCSIALFGFFGVLFAIGDYFNVDELLAEQSPYVVESIPVPEHLIPPPVVVKYSDPQPHDPRNWQVPECGSGCID